MNRRRAVIAAVAGTLALSACHLPTYGGVTERNEIGCKLRGGTYVWLNQYPGDYRLICSGEQFSYAQCVNQLATFDPDRFDGGQRDRVCSTSDVQVWGSEGFIDPNWGH
jgi:hypothetical protein